jgi:hypothetical protein
MKPADFIACGAFRPIRCPLPSVNFGYHGTLYNSMDFCGKSWPCAVALMLICLAFDTNAFQATDIVIVQRTKINI